MEAEGQPLLVRCPAKLNLFLEVVRRRPDGYHDLDTVMQAVDLYDDLHIEPRPGSALSLECDDPSLPTDGRNLALRAAIALRDRTGCHAGAHLALAKRIPQQAGLGGGSSDAAGALVGLNAAWGLGLSTEELRGVAAAVGSDVAFFLFGGAARCTGRGEVVEPVAATLACDFVLVCPPFAVPTAEAYARLRLPLTSARPSASMLLRHLAGNDVVALAETLYNRLEEPAFDIHPELGEIKGRLVATGLFAGVGMTGSGSALFGLCRREECDAAYKSIAAMGLGDVHRVRSIDHGVQALRCP